MEKLVKLRGSLIAISTVLVMGFGLTGTVGASAVASISDTGPDSYNKISLSNNLSIRISNDNRVNIVNNNPQTAKTGDATVGGNTHGGSAQSGDATNRSNFNASVNIDNSSSTKGFFGGHGGDVKASIKDTGPDSVNKIDFNNKLDCRETNYNNINAINNNRQIAESGDVSVGGDGWMFNWNNWSPDNWKDNGSNYDNWYNNLNKWVDENARSWDNKGSSNSDFKGGDSWNDYSPLVWQSNGQNYDQWKAGFDSYMNKHKDELRNKFGGNTYGGDAVSGNASNYSDAEFNVNISNKNHCVSAVKPVVHKPGVPGLPGQGAFVPENFGQPSPGQGGLGTGGEGELGEGFGEQRGLVGGLGAGPSEQHKNPVPGQGALEEENKAKKGDNFTISNTGPDSYNKISLKNDTSVNINNDNNVSITNNNSQYASSGDASVVGNTYGGNAGSGDASNYSSATVGVTIKN